MQPDLWQSLLLIVVGAGITLGTTLLVQVIGGKQSDERDRVRRDEERDQARQDSLMSNVRDLHMSLLDIGERGRRTLSGLDFDVIEVERLITVVRHGFTIVPDVAVRASLADALQILANRATAKVSMNDWTRAADSGAFVVAAYIRGDPLPPGPVAFLAELRQKYPRPPQLDQR
jgi:hypothetical protein